MLLRPMGLTGSQLRNANASRGRLRLELPAASDGITEAPLGAR